MICLDCEKHVSRALKRAAAVKATADLRRGEVRLCVPEGISESALSSARRAAGNRSGSSKEIPSASPAQQSPPTRVSSGARTYDRAIIGSVGAAFAAAIGAWDLGTRVVMIDCRTIGRTCVNIDCVLSRTLLRAGDTHRKAGYNVS